MKRRVMPIFCVITPVRIVAPLLKLDLDVDACSQVELHQRVHGLGCRIDDVQKPLVRADFELFATLLVDVRRAVHREAFDARRQRDRTSHLRAGTLRRVHDLLGGVVENPVVEGFEPYTDVLALHIRSPTAPLLPYFKILTTTPAPTVRPPSRMAKRSFSSIAIGTISSTSTVTLAPGITISVPAGSLTIPVTSVVRK